MAFLLVFVLAMHTLTVHGFTESLVYCFEGNGDVNLESTSSYSLGFTKKSDVHSEISHSHNQNDHVIHASDEGHKDVDVSLICSKDNNLNRLNKDKVIQTLISKIKIADYFPQVQNFKISSSQQLFFVDDMSKALQTIVLLI